MSTFHSSLRRASRQLHHLLEWLVWTLSTQRRSQLVLVFIMSMIWGIIMARAMPLHC